MGIAAERVDDIEEGAHAGAFEYFRSGDRPIAGMIFACPCGCGRLSALDFRPHASPAWDWDGSLEKPTLNPSVHWQDEGAHGRKRTHWHGWLRDGVWESCQ